MSNIGMMLFYFAFINFSLYIQMNIDKTRKYFNSLRISEFTLLLLAIGGGAIGGTLSMWINGHKKNKWHFRTLFPILALIDCYLIYTVATLL
ncbi:MAG: hypothetical protein K0R71_1927 [Bacillales bacterium]|jgi:uncharacterized membrane protein YsdA (DUF1294 family)|nr:hypothetical protein [Bacillales bacterium]